MADITEAVAMKHIVVPGILGSCRQRIDRKRQKTSSVRRLYSPEIRQAHAASDMILRLKGASGREAQPLFIPETDLASDYAALKTAAPASARTDGFFRAFRKFTSSPWQLVEAWDHYL